MDALAASSVIFAFRGAIMGPVINKLGQSSVSTTVFFEPELVVDEQLRALINRLGDGNQLRYWIQLGGVHFTGYNSEAAHDVMGPPTSPTSPLDVSAGHQFWKGNAIPLPS